MLEVKLDEIDRAIVKEELRAQDIKREERMLTDMRYLPYGMILQIRENHKRLVRESESTIKDLYRLKIERKKAEEKKNVQCEQAGTL